MNSAKTSANRGFTLIELLITIIVIAIICGFVYSRIGTARFSNESGEALLTSLTDRVTARHAAALRLNQTNRATTLTAAATNPLEIDFTNSATTATLVTDGADADKNGIDDQTGLTLTRLAADGTWIYGYEPDALRIPAAWKPLTTASGITLPAKAVLVTNVAFDGSGQAYTRNSSGSYTSLKSSADFSFYFICFAFELNNERHGFIGIAVHQSGQIEKFRYANGVWTGYGGRTNA